MKINILTPFVSSKMSLNYLKLPSQFIENLENLKLQTKLIFLNSTECNDSKECEECEEVVYFERDQKSFLSLKHHPENSTIEGMFSSAIVQHVILEILKMYGHTTTSIYLNQIVEGFNCVILNALPNLNSIELKCGNGTDKYIYHGFFRHIRVRFPSIKKIKISLVNSLDSSSTGEILQSLSSIPHLEELSITRMRGVLEIPLRMDFYPQSQLKSLELIGLPISKENLFPIFENCKNLETFTIRDCKGMSKEFVQSLKTMYSVKN